MGKATPQYVHEKGGAMNNHFKTALHDEEVKALYKDKPYHMAILYALSAYKEKGFSLYSLPWFSITKDAKRELNIKKAA